MNFFSELLVLTAISHALIYTRAKELEDGLLRLTIKIASEATPYLVASQFADNSSVANFSPKHIPFSKKTWIHFSPVRPQSPRKNIIFFFFFIFFHIICQISVKISVITGPGALALGKMKIQYRLTYKAIKKFILLYSRRGSSALLKYV